MPSLGSVDMSVDRDALALTIRHSGVSSRSPEDKRGVFPSHNSVPILERRYTLIGPGSETLPDLTGLNGTVDVDLDADEKLRLSVCARGSIARLVASGGASPKKRVRRNNDQHAVPPIKIATIDTDPEDGKLCTFLRDKARNLPIAESVGPRLEIYEDGAVELHYGLALVPDAQVLQRSLHRAALLFLARALDDPSLVDPMQYMASPGDLLRILTREPAHNAPEIAPPGLQTNLLPYQRETVGWCLRREGKELSSSCTVIPLDPEIRDVVVSPPLGWRVIPGSNVWANPYLLWTLSTEPRMPPVLPEIEYAGRGLLAEEMGLGKTLEMMSLILLNQRPAGQIGLTLDPRVGEEVWQIKGTLVVAPRTIISQWYYELKRHAPVLNTRYFRPDEDSIESLSEADIVLVSYSQLSAQLQNAVFDPKRRSTRHNYFREAAELNHFRSKLVQVQFWRVILDEVQMVHSGVSAAARAAQRIPRVHAWAASGTPVKQSLEDLRGLLSFLDLRPFVERPCWQRLISSPVDFEQTMRTLGLRHTKPLVASQLYLPPQHRQLILLRFSEVERLRYDRLYQRFQEESTSSNVNLYLWLLRLRQACSHATSGGSTNADDTLLTIDQLLGQLVDEAYSAVWARQRERIFLRIEKGQLLDKADKMSLALAVWHQEAADIKADIKAIDARLSDLTEISDRNQKAYDELKENYDNYAEKTEADEIVPEINLYKIRLENRLADASHSLTVANNHVKGARTRRRALQDLLHRTYFYLGTGYFRKSQRLRLRTASEELESEDIQNELRDNSAKESQFYDLAESVRTEMLQEAAERVDQLQAKAQTMRYRHIHKLISIPKAEVLDKLGQFITDMVSQLLDILTQPLMEEKVEGAKPGELTDHDAYGKTLDLQEHAYLLLETLQTVLRDRAAAINGGAIQGALAVSGAEDKEFASKLASRREDIVPLLRHETTPLATIMRSVGGVSHDVIEELRESISSSQKQYIALRDLYNGRVEYYKQLQDLSDQVEDIDIGDRDAEQMIVSKEIAIGRTDKSISELLSRLRYLQTLEGANHRQAQARDETEQTPCLICQELYTVGALTPCGHLFCLDCIQKWLEMKGNCPMCKQKTSLNEIMTFKLNEGDEGEDDQAAQLRQKSLPAEEDTKTVSTEIFSQISDNLYNQILHEPIHRMYGIKIDMIVRHVKFLRSQDPTSQIVIFSQWAPMLRVLKTALSENEILTAALNSRPGVDAFREDPRVACILLHAKADVAGLTLVNANHVFLCEPLLNTAIELQAVSRINRIGQTRETTVWQFCVENTVEQTILGMTTKDRLLNSAKFGMDLADSSALAEAQSKGNLVDRKSGAEIVGEPVLREILLKTSR